MKPEPGDVVLYKLSDLDVEDISNRRRYVKGYGSPVSPGDTFPAVVVKTYGGSEVNLQVHLDGSDLFWATCRHEGKNLGQWRWRETFQPIPADWAEEIAIT